MVMGMKYKGIHFRFIKEYGYLPVLVVVVAAVVAMLGILPVLHHQSFYCMHSGVSGR